MDFRHIPSLIYESLKEWYSDNVSLLAAALAYYTIFAIAPMFIFVVSLASLILRRDDARQWLLQNTSAFAGPEVRNAIANILEGIQSTPATLIATLAGLVTFFLGTTRIISHLRYSFNLIWEIPPKPGGGVWDTVKGRLFLFLIVIFTGIFLILLAVASAFLSSAGEYLDSVAPRLGVILQFSNVLVSLVLGTIVFAIMFKFLPDASIAWTDVWIGAGVTAVLFFLGKQVLGWYFGGGAVRSAYGAAGSVIVIILWIYYSSQIIFFGAEFTQVYARRYGTRIRRKSRSREEKLRSMHASSHHLR